MRVSMDLVIRRNRLPAISQEAREALIEATLEGTQEIYNLAVGNAPRDTRALRDSIYYITATRSTYDRAIAKAMADYDRAEANGKTPRGRTPTYPEFSDEMWVKDELTGMVVCPIHYAEHVEFGTVRTPAHPFMIPAYRQGRPLFTQAATNILRRKWARL